MTYPHPITHEEAWQLFTKPVPKPLSGKASKSSPVDRRPPEESVLSVRCHNPKWLDLCWWNGLYWQYITTRPA
jgi:hypothetical protein